MTVTGFNQDKYKIIKGTYNEMGCYGELRVAYCITQSLPYLDCHCVGTWEQTFNSLDWKSFNKGFELPLPYSSLYDYNGICFVLYSTCTDSSGVYDQYLAACHLPLYNSRKIFRNGIYELELHELGRYDVYSLDDVLEVVLKEHLNAKPQGMEELTRLLKINRKQLREELYETPLDRQASLYVERTIEDLKRESNKLFLSVKFEFSLSYPNLYIPVIFKRRDLYSSSALTWHERWNPIDEMYIRMTRNMRTADLDRERKATKETLDRLTEILECPPCELPSEHDSDLIWKYRFFIANRFPEAALPKFLLSVRWEYPEQVSQTVEVLQMWPVLAPEHLLELLTRKFFHPVCRRFAVSRLECANDEEILIYLYQLVQALRYESWDHLFSVSMPQKKPDARAIEVKPSSQDDQTTLHHPTTLTTSVDHSSQKSHTLIHYSKTYESIWKLDLPGFLVQRASNNFELANFFFWFLKLEASDSTPSSVETRSIFELMLQHFLATLQHGDEIQSAIYREITRQKTFTSDLDMLLHSIQEESSKRTRKIEILRAKLRSEAYSSLVNFVPPLPLPLDPNFLISRIDPESASLFKSTTQPALLSLVSPKGDLYRIIYKVGDDLRQDQLVLQMIRLMDVILQKEKFNLQLTPYGVLAISCRQGFIQFIDSTPIAGTRHGGSILNYLQRCAPSQSDPLKVQKKVMDTYVRSCAGYCVITYLLGVGDRHMENIMLTSEGQLFHIDFGFILGNDPKPMAPEVRLTKAMIEAMGGPQTQQFNEFWKICLTAFLSLRRHANLFFTLFSLIQDAGIHDITRGPNKPENFLKERFCTGQTDEKAANRFASRLTDSIKAIVPEMIERIHSVVQYMRD